MNFYGLEDQDQNMILEDQNHFQDHFAFSTQRNEWYEEEAINKVALSLFVCNQYFTQIFCACFGTCYS